MMRSKNCEVLDPRPESLASRRQLLVCWPSGARDGRAHLILCRELLWRQMAKTRVRPFPMVFDSPLFDFAARIVERNKDMFVKTYMDPTSAQGFLSMKAFLSFQGLVGRPRHSYPDVLLDAHASNQLPVYVPKITHFAQFSALGAAQN